jgi:hypothetical protein
MSRLRGVEYHEQLAIAEAENWPCVRDTIEGAKLRAGQFWDEEKRIDRRDATSAVPEKR